MRNNKNQKNSLIMYTALIFIVAIIIVILAFLAQTHYEKNSKPLPSPTQTAAQSATPSQAPSDAPQGIKKTAAQLSEDNLKLLDENRELLKKSDELEKENELYKKLIEGYVAYSAGDNERAKSLISGITYEDLNSDAKTLYDLINIQ